jgi:hypothetical protein
MASETVPDIKAVVEEFGRLLDTFGQQLAVSIEESNREYLAVGDAFQELAAAKKRINGIVCQEPDQTVLKSGCERIGESLDAAVVALQFHDRLAQRVGHIRAGLDQLQAVLRDGRERSYDVWLILLRNVEQAQAKEQRRLAAGASQGLSDSYVELF